MSSRRANVRNPKNYGTICDIEAHHYVNSNALDSGFILYTLIRSLPLLATLNKNMVPP